MKKNTKPNHTKPTLVHFFVFLGLREVHIEKTMDKDISIAFGERVFPQGLRTKGRVDVGLA